jgi:2-keto-4-pentenoate hydratase
MWRVLKLETLVWAHMYDDTVRYAQENAASLSLANMYSPKIEPEIVFKLKRPLGDGPHDASTVLDAVEWLALGFEIIDCVFADWKFQPSDFVAAFGLHAALVVGEPRAIEASMIPSLVEQLPRFKVRLLKDGHLVEEGSGKNSLRSPALCLGELASAIVRQSPEEPLEAGELVSSGTLTESQPIAPGQTWTATVEGLDLPDLTLTVH